MKTDNYEQKETGEDDGEEMEKLAEVNNYEDILSFT